jgi:hypothetical protein
VLSVDAANVWLFGEKAMIRTLPKWLLSDCSSMPELTSYSLILWPVDADANWAESGEKITKYMMLSLLVSRSLSVF